MKLGVQLSVVAVALATSLQVTAQSLEPALKASEKIVASAAQSQQKINRMTDDIDSKIQQYKAINKETEGLSIYNRQLEKQIQNQIDELGQLDESIDQVSVIERQITPLMLRMIDGLAAFVELDVPFLPKERSDRVAGLKKMMDRADVAVSEKFRRVLEAYQVETDYGRTIEAYTDNLDLKGQGRDVDFLRIGRVALIYQTRDGSESGIWDNEQKQWSSLDSEHRIQIAKGLRMARKQLAPDMLTLPIKSAE